MAERICHDALSFRASTFGRGSFLLMIAKLPELLSKSGAAGFEPFFGTDLHQPKSQKTACLHCAKPR